MHICICMLSISTRVPLVNSSNFVQRTLSLLSRSMNLRNLLRCQRGCPGRLDPGMHLDLTTSLAARVVAASSPPPSSVTEQRAPSPVLLPTAAPGNSSGRALRIEVEVAGSASAPPPSRHWRRGRRCRSEIEVGAPRGRVRDGHFEVEVGAAPGRSCGCCER